MKTRRQSSLGTRVWMRVGLLTVITAASIVTTIVAAVTIALLIAHRDIKVESADAAREFDVFLSSVEADVRSTSDALTHTDDPVEIMRLLLVRHPEIYTVQLLDPSGDVSLQRRRVGTATQEQMDAQPWLPDVTNGKSFWGSAQIDELGNPFIELAVPYFEHDFQVSSENIFAGTLLVSLDLSSFWDAIRAIHIGDSGYAYIVDTDGRLLAYHDVSVVRQNTPLQAFIDRSPQEIVANSSDVYGSIYTGLADKAVLSSGVGLVTVPWVAVVEQPIAEALAPFVGWIVLLGVFLFVTILLLANIQQFTRRRIVAPLIVLRDGVEEYQRGNLAHRLHMRDSDEIGLLGKTLNNMASSVEKHTQELVAAEARAQESSRLKSEFMSTMSHELRTPLNAVLGFTNIMLDGMGGEIDDDAKHMLERIKANSNHLLGMINDILDLAKIEAGRMELKAETFDPHDLADEWGLQMAGLAARSGLQYSVEISDAVPQALVGDVNRLTQIAMNLISNAFKFTKEGRVDLRLDWQDDAWLIQVCDSGIGIAQEQLAIIFEAFRQVDGSYQRAYGGTGLGLAIVRTLSDMMHGTVTVESQQGHGSTFTVKLPLAIAELSPAVVE